MAGHITLINPTLGSLVFDGVVRVGFEESARVTQHPIEDGTTITDHVQAEPLPIIIEGAVSQSPWPDSPNALSLNPSIDAVSWLRSSIGVLLTVVSLRDGTFTNMAIQRFSHETTKVTGKRFSVELIQIIIAATGVTIIPPSAPSSFQAGEDVGSQAMTEVGVDESSQAGQAQSIIQAIRG